MEPQCRLEPLFETWANWEWSQIPNGAALLQSSQQLTKHSVELTHQVAELSLRSSVNAMQTFCSAASLFQQAWLQAAVAFSGGIPVAVDDDGSRLLIEAEERAEKPGRISAEVEARDDWGAADVDAALNSHAA